MAGTVSEKPRRMPKFTKPSKNDIVISLTRNNNIQFSDGNGKVVYFYSKRGEIKEQMPYTQSHHGNFYAETDLNVGDVISPWGVRELEDIAFYMVTKVDLKKHRAMLRKLRVPEETEDGSYPEELHRILTRIEHWREKCAKIKEEGDYLRHKGIVEVVPISAVGNRTLLNYAPNLFKNNCDLITLDGLELYQSQIRELKERGSLIAKLKGAEKPIQWWRHFHLRMKGENQVEITQIPRSFAPLLNTAEGG